MREGDRFGPYLLEERLAVGGMAEVFRARRLGAAGFSRPVCIKRILPALCKEREFVEMFIDEARTGAQLRHGNIVGIEDFGEVDGLYYLCMELVSGVDYARLLQTLARGGYAMPLDAAAHVAADVLRALDYAHRKLGEDGRPLELVHRDVSPHNVLLSFAGEARLTDFGIARAATRLHQTTGYVVKGKLAYMAPEQARGQRIDGRADLFAAGVLLYESLAGRRPFAGRDETELVTRLLRGERPALRSLRPDVPPALEACCDRLLAVPLEQRFASAGDALDALLAVGLGGGGGRTLSTVLAHCFPEHPSAVRSAPGAAALLLPRAPAVEPREPSGGAAQPTAAQGARAGATEVDPTLPAGATPWTHGAGAGATSNERAEATPVGAGGTQVGLGPRGAHDAHDAHDAQGQRERTEVLAPRAGAGEADRAALATRTSLRPQHEREGSVPHDAQAPRPPAGATEPAGPRARTEATASRGLPGWAYALVGAAGLGAGIALTAALLR